MKCNRPNGKCDDDPDCLWNGLCQYTELVPYRNERLVNVQIRRVELPLLPIDEEDGEK